MSAGEVKNAIHRGIRLAIQQSNSRQTAKTDFGSVVKQGPSHKPGSVLSGARVAAPLVPGSSVLSTAVAGIFQEIHEGVEEIERELKSNPAARAEATLVLPDIEAIKREFRSIMAKLERRPPQR